MRRIGFRTCWGLAPLVLCARADIAVRFDIDVSKGNRAISPLLFGSNSDELTAADGVTFRRAGGNRLTGYNWENNASHAGTDWQNSSDAYMGGGEIPGKALTDFHAKSLANGQQSVITLPAAGYVAKDKKGTVSAAETAPSPRWAKVVFEKGSAFTTSPDPNDDAVYVDEFVAFMGGRYGKADAHDGVRHWEVDNEPGLWPSTHPRLHPAKTGAVELVEKTVALAAAVKKVDPQSEIFGGVFYGYGDYADLQGAPDWKTVNAGSRYAWYLDYFLDAMKKASDQAGVRLLDVLDLHWYSEATGDHRVNDTAAHTDKDRAARLQAPRSLWDPEYAESSWISKWATPKQPVTDWNDPTPGPIDLLPRVQASIDRYFPGTRIAITEYNYGEADHVTGGLATADFLGVAAVNGVYAAAFWQLDEKPAYVAAALRLFRNYDGQRGGSGSVSAQAAASDRDAASVFASFDPGGNAIHVLAINKHPTETVAGTFTVAGPVALAGAKAWGFDGSSPTIAPKPDAAVNGNAFAYRLPPWSATHFVIKTDGALPAAALRPPLPRAPKAAAGPSWLPDGRAFGPSRAGVGRSIPVFAKP